MLRAIAGALGHRLIERIPGAVPPGSCVNVDRMLLTLALLAPLLSYSFFGASRPLPEDADRIERDTKAKAAACLILYGTAIPAVMLGLLLQPGTVWLVTPSHAFVACWTAACILSYAGLGVMKYGILKRAREGQEPAVHEEAALRARAAWLAFMGIATLLIFLYGSDAGWI